MLLHSSIPTSCKQRISASASLIAIQIISTLSSNNVSLFHTAAIWDTSIEVVNYCAIRAEVDY